MPRPTFPLTPASSTDIKGQDGTRQLAAAGMQMSFELLLPPPALAQAEDEDDEIDDDDDEDEDEDVVGRLGVPPSPPTPIKSTRSPLPPLSTTAKRGAEAAQDSHDTEPDAPRRRSQPVRPAPYPLQPSETVKSRKRGLSAQQPLPPLSQHHHQQQHQQQQQPKQQQQQQQQQQQAAQRKSQFSLPPPPTRSRKIIQVKPRSQEAAPASAPAGSGKTAGTKTPAAAPVAAGPAAAGGKKKPPSSTSAAGRKMARKTAHSLIERRRRSKMNEEFAVLKGMIPACTGEMHKLAILQASIEYVRYLEDCVAKLQAEREADQETLPPSELGDGPSPQTAFVPEPSQRYPPSLAGDASSPEVHMIHSEPLSPSVSPALLAQDDGAPSAASRRGSELSGGRGAADQPQRHYSFGSFSLSANASPAFGPQDQRHHPQQPPYHGNGSSSSTSHYRYGQSGTHSAEGSAYASPALAPLRDLDQEAMAALMMLNQSDRRRAEATSGQGPASGGRGMSVRDLLTP
ncbi:hypothetical protein VTK73DRAFT_6753 [Phialemonium thermophilum]|uniref:BHLH domain-containing protein n=1 Tax=Phialemonium thermophilum TaxID=223376 RepID=A0ABR3WI45_9PEZI